MAHDEEPLLANPPSQEAATHVADYERFTAMMKWGAIICLILAFIAVIVIKSYW
ncbi:hypothetical protein GCM10022276_06650 [Sphingomonas limnosediminicola]|jgi:hypothetical protein|uniref:Aa3-type cytochrome c oxidase subunit IV n=1 Tax=Sphingomonas limnosediminicola TaxID=940133 RepID=A0ABP7L0F2_9SPHN